MDRHLDTDWLGARLREQTAAFAAAIDGADPAAAVPTCPKWQVRNLVGHIGQAHRWSAEIVRTRKPSAVPDPLDADPGEPHAWSAWLRAGAAELVAAVAATGAETPVWWFLGNAPARVWLRRMMADTTVHRVDAALTTGAPFDIADDLATDILNEGFALFATPGMDKLKTSLAQLRGNGETLAFRPEPPGGPGWLITCGPDGLTCEPRAGAADVTVTGPVVDLLLVVTRRLAPDKVAISGDRALLDHWLANTGL